MSHVNVLPAIAQLPARGGWVMIHVGPGGSGSLSWTSRAIPGPSFGP